MAKHHASVAYVEPNDVFSGLTAAAGDGNTYDRAPDLEDYCIALDIEVELSSRENAVKETTKGNTVIVMSYRSNGNGEDDRVSFMSGSKMQLGGIPNVLTTKYADMFVTDLVDYGTTEMIGIKSLDIEYNSACVPIITIKFTDVRGMSLFQPTELNNNKSYNGIRGFGQGNIAQSFFHSFFVLPLPKFTVYVKGFYGRPVSYEVMCDKFDAAFNSQTGDFDITARFIGFAYSFMADISFDVLLAAPYSDYIGAKYWNNNVKNGRFRFLDKTGQNMVDMPRLYDIRKWFKTMLNSSDESQEVTTVEDEEKTHDLEIGQLDELKRLYRSWYSKLYSLAVKKYGEDYVYVYGGTEGEEFQRIIILTNGQNISGNTLADEYLQYDNDFKQTNDDLYNAIKTYNNSSEAYRKLTNVSQDFSKYGKVKLFQELWYNDNKKEIIFEGFHRDNVLPRTETIRLIFGKDENLRKKKLKTIYYDGVHQYIDAFVIEVDYGDVKRRIDSLIEDSNKAYEQKLKEKKLKEHNRYMFEKMKWYPSIENFTKIVMAHLETFMAMMYGVVGQTTGRTASQLGVTIGDDGDCCDVNSDAKIVPPFPRVTKLITDENGFTKREDAWVGNFNRGIGFKEVDMVNGLLNGVAMIKKIEDSIRASLAETNRELAPQDAGMKCVMKFPLTSFDMFLNKNPYGTESDLSNDKYAFAGKICMRMFDILCLNSLRWELKSDWVSMTKEIAETEAENFYNLVKISNPDLICELGDYGSLSTGEQIIDIVTGTATDKMPWFKGRNSRPLFNEADNFWLDRYSTSHSDYKLYVYPIQNMSFDSLENSLNIFNGDQIETENGDITVNRVRDVAMAIRKFWNENDESNVLNTVYINRLLGYVKNTLQEAAANESESYTGIAEILVNAATLNEHTIDEYRTFFCKGPDDVSDFISSFNLKNPDGFEYSGITYYKDTKKNAPLELEGYVYKCNLEELEGYFTNDIANGTVNTGTITEVFGFKKDKADGKEIYVIDKDRSLFLTEEFYLGLTSWETSDFTFTLNDVRAAFFLMGVDCFTYCGLNNSAIKSFTIAPALLVLQIGAILAAHSAVNGIGSGFGSSEAECKKVFNRIRTKLHVPANFEYYSRHFLNNLSPLGRIAFVKVFLKWVDENFSSIEQHLFIGKYNITDTSEYKYADSNAYKAIYRAYTEASAAAAILDYVPSMLKPAYIVGTHYLGASYGKGEVLIHRALLNQDSEFVQTLTNNLMTPVLIARATINSTIVPTSDKSTNSSICGLTKSQVKTYLDAFLTRLRDLIGIGQPEKRSNNATTIAKEPSQVNEDMKIELYRYLKQVFDKWIPTTASEDWKYETFFRESDSNSGNTSGNTTEYTGHLFHFIDSYYNKIGNKLLINPLKLSEKIRLSTAYSDVNVMMYNFLAEVYAEHRCMMKCIQNFRDLSKGMDDLFKPLSYMQMGRPDRSPDFVVIYTYSASKCLNIANSEFNDDGFMLNDELETPLAIRTRGGSEDGSSEPSKYYKIPAFGVSYGRQYQSYFKDISVDMSNPIMTQQAIVAKHMILEASRDEKSKIVTAQDLYDIYTNQSYTCKVEMMGCTWVQPLMYFVLLNIPMFRGSYMIMKVTHKMRPGDMSTEIVGCRMANVSNRLVEDIFTDEMDENEDGTNDRSRGGDRSDKANVNNDCPYKVFPVSEDIGNDVQLSGDEKQKAHTLMKKLMETYGYTKEAAAGIVGNIRQEVGEGFDFTKMPANGGKDSDGYYAAGFCQWNDHYGNLTKLLTKTTTRYGDKEKDGSIKRVAASWGVQKIKSTLASYGADYQLWFIDQTIGQVTVNSKSKKKYSKGMLNACKSPENAAESFRLAYERGDNPQGRMMYAKGFYNSYHSSTPTPAPQPNKEPTHNTKNFPELFFNAVQKSAFSSPLTSVNLEPTYKDGGFIMIKQKDGKRDKLGNIFDVILNGYYQYVQNLIWYYNNAPNEEPLAIVATVAENPKIANRSIFILKQSDTQKSVTDIPNDPTQINEKFLRAIAKRYPDPVNNKILVKEVPQFRGKQEMLKDYVPGECPTCNSEG